MKTRVTYTLVVEIEDIDRPGIDQEKRAVDLVIEEPMAFIELSGSNLTVTSERITSD